jgi:hypothetical protein
MKPGAARPTVRLAPAETAALLQSGREAGAPDAATVEMVPVEAKLARGSQVVSRRHLRGPRRPRTTLRADEIAPRNKR